MRTIVITPPQPVVSWADIDQHLALGGDTSRQSYVEGLAAAATAMIDGPRGWLGRAIGEQVLEARFNSFACTDLMLPYPEIQTILSVKYIDPDGIEQTMDPADFEVAGRVLFPKWGTAWPATRGTHEAVKVRYQAGYLDVPEPIKRAILTMTADQFAARESFAMGTVSAVPSAADVDRLLGSYRVFL
jgi:uncharacterized phiE125 gp8 family phage protein